jgi:hypothetical protein
MKRFLALACLAACDGTSGTLSISLTTAPDRSLDAVLALRVTVTNPPQQYTIERTSSGFDLELDLDATGEQSSLLIEGLDATGSTNVVGATPQFPLGALNGAIVIYLAPPNSIAAAPVALDPPRADLGAGTLTYGALLAGGTLVGDAPSDALSIYNAFNHSLVAGMPLPAARSAPVVGVGAHGIVYILGGVNLWRFDTTVAPAGAYNDFGEKLGFGRTGETFVPLGADQFILTGAPPAELAGLSGVMTARTDVESLPRGATSLVASDGAVTAIFVGPAGVQKLRMNTFTSLTIANAARPDAAVVTLPNARVGVFCGDVVRIDPAAGTGELIATGEPRTGCAAAATSKHVIVAGGKTASGVVGTADIYDATTLALVGTRPLVVPRSNASAIALPNGQVLIAGGRDANDAPVGTLELFTPAN